jgi:WD40 repeat protein
MFPPVLLLAPLNAQLLLAPAPQPGSHLFEEIGLNTRILAFAPTRGLLAVVEGAWNEPGIIQLIDLRKHEVQQTLRGHEHGIASIAFGPDGDWLASGGIEGQLILWDLKSGTPPRKLAKVRGAAGVLPPGDGKHLFVQHNGVVEVLDLATGTSADSFELDNLNKKGHVCDYRPLDGTVVIERNGRIALWDVKKKEELSAVEVHSVVHSFCLSSTGNHLAIACGPDVLPFKERFGGKRPTPQQFQGMMDELRKLPERVQLWDLTNRERVASYTCDKDERPSAIAISPRSKWVVFGTEQRTLSRMLLVDETGGFRFPPVLVDGPHGAHEAGRLYLWDPESKDPLLLPHPQDVAQVTVSPDGKWIAASGSKGVALYEIERLKRDLHPAPMPRVPLDK